MVLIVILQLWLLTATMNAYLGGDTRIVVPAALASLVCLGLNAGLLWYLLAWISDGDRRPTPSDAGWLERSRTSFPAISPLVMATGIVSIAAHVAADAAHRLGAARHQYRRLYDAALMLASGSLVYFPRVLDDLNNHARGPASSPWWPGRACWAVSS